MLAVPGDAACHELAPCASGTWGSIPVEPSTQHVDPAYAGMTSDGSAQQPWTSIAAAIAAAPLGAIVALAAGTYAEDVVITKRVRLWGRCPALVAITGVGAGPAVLVADGAEGAELVALSITGSDSGLMVSDADVLAEHVRVHDNPHRGVVVADNGFAHLLGSLVELNGEAGVSVSNGQAVIEASVVRDSLPDSAGLNGYGVDVSWDTGGIQPWGSIWESLIEHNHNVGVHGAGANIYVNDSVVRDTFRDRLDVYSAALLVRRDPNGIYPGSLSMLRSLVERNQDLGIHVESSFGEITGSVVRQTLANVGDIGSGIVATIHPTTGGDGELHVAQSLVEENAGIGLYASGSKLAVSATAVRRNLPNDGEDFGRGVEVWPSLDGLTPASLSMNRSAVEDNFRVGIVTTGGEARIETTLVRGTQLDGEGSRGYGIALQAVSDFPTTLDLFASMIEQNHTAGVLIDGGDALLREVVIRNTIGRGVSVQRAFDLPASLTLQSALIEGNQEAGVAVLGGTARIDKSIVRDTRAIDDGRFGDGVLVLSNDAPADAAVVQSRIEASARAAISAFGAHAALGQSRLACQAFDVAIEPYRQVPSPFEDLGQNWCGCPVAESACKLVTADLEAPPQ